MTGRSEGGPVRAARAFKQAGRFPSGYSGESLTFYSPRDTDLISGSTNWSFGGEELQDNQLTLSRNPLFASEARAVIDLDHDAMLKQMGKRKPTDFLKKVPKAPSNGSHKLPAAALVGLPS